MPGSEKLKGALMLGRPRVLALPDISLASLVRQGFCRTSHIAHVLAGSEEAVQVQLELHLSCIQYAIQGLQDAIGLSVTHSTWQRTKPGTDDQHCGWAFASSEDSPLQSSTGELFHIVLVPYVAVQLDVN